MSKKEMMRCIIALEQLVEEQAKMIKAQDEIIRTQAELIKRLQEQLNMNSKNSSKPPSSDGFNKPKIPNMRKPSEKKPGAQWGHNGNKGLEFPETPDEVRQHLPQNCLTCPDREQCKSQVMQKRNEIDIEIRLIHRQHQTIGKQCPKTGDAMIGDFPKNITGNLQYGANLKALAIALNTAGMVSINRTSEILKDVFGARISVGTVQAMVKSGAAVVRPDVDNIKERIKQEEIVNLDETGTKADSHTMWAHVASTALLTHISVEESRGKAGMEAAGIVPFLRSIGVHDCYASYFTFAFIHALCNAHILRELTGIFENYGQKWADEMLELLREMKRTKDELLESGAREAPNETWENFSEKFDRLVEKAIAENPPLPPTEPGKRPKRPKPLVLAERLKERKAGFLLFFANFDVPFDNNQAERDFRMFKVKQKVSGCFRSKDGAVDFAIIMSFLGTARKHGLSAFSALRDALIGKPFILNTLLG